MWSVAVGFRSSRPAGLKGYPRRFSRTSLNRSTPHRSSRKLSRALLRASRSP